MQAQVSQVLTPIEEARERRRDQVEIITAVATILLAAVTLARTAPKYTMFPVVVELKLLPLMTTVEPTEPAEGEKELMVG